MFNKLTFKVRFHIVVSLKTFLKTNRFPAKFAREALTKSAVLYQSFSSETGLQNSREIGRFFREFVPENPAKFDFFSATYQKPCPYHAACMNVSRNAFFSSRPDKNNFFNIDIAINNKSEMWFIVVCTLINNEYVSLLFSQTFFILFLHIERVCKSF